MEPIDISLEQQFKLRVLEAHIQGLSQEQLQKLLVNAVRQLMVKNNLIRCSSTMLTAHIEIISQ